MREPLDLLDWLHSQREELASAHPTVDEIGLGLWEGGVRVSLVSGGLTVGIKLRERIDGPAYRVTPSTTIALELPAGGGIPEGLEAVVHDLICRLEAVDEGSFSVPADTREEVDPEAPTQRRELVEHAAWRQLGEDRSMVLSGLACVADQLDAVSSWHAELEPLWVLEGDGLSGGRGLDALVEFLGDLDGRPFAIDARASTACLVSVVAAAAPGQVARVYVVPSRLAEVPEGVTRVAVLEDPTQRPPPLAAAHQVLMPAEEAVLPMLPMVLEVLGVAGVQLVLAPARKDPVPLDELAAAIDGLPESAALALAGLPACVSPARDRADAHLAATESAVLTEACRYCDLAERCPGVPSSWHERWGMRGVSPQFRD